MEQITGFTVERPKSGKPMFAHIDLHKHANLIPVLESNGSGIGKSPYDQEFVAKIRRAEKQPSVKVDINNLWK